MCVEIYALGLPRKILMTEDQRKIKVTLYLSDLLYLIFTYMGNLYGPPLYLKFGGNIGDLYLVQIKNIGLLSVFLALFFKFSLRLFCSAMYGLCYKPVRCDQQEPLNGKGTHV